MEGILCRAQSFPCPTWARWTRPLDGFSAGASLQQRVIGPQIRENARLQSHGAIGRFIEQGAAVWRSKLECMREASPRLARHGLVCQCSAAFSYPGFVVVLLVTNLTRCTHDTPLLHQHAADEHVRGNGLKTKIARIPAGTRLTWSAPPSQSTRSATSTGGVEERLSKPPKPLRLLHSVLIPFQTLPPVAFSALDAPESRRRRSSTSRRNPDSSSSQIESQLPAPSQPVQVPPSADLSLIAGAFSKPATLALVPIQPTNHQHQLHLTCIRW